MRSGCQLWFFLHLFSIFHNFAAFTITNCFLLDKALPPAYRNHVLPTISHYGIVNQFDVAKLHTGWRNCQKHGCWIGVLDVFVSSGTAYTCIHGRKWGFRNSVENCFYIRKSLWISNSSYSNFYTVVGALMHFQLGPIHNSQNWLTQSNALR